MDLPEQGVYIERRAGSGEVRRVTKGDNDAVTPPACPNGLGAR